MVQRSHRPGATPSAGIPAQASVFPQRRRLASDGDAVGDPQGLRLRLSRASPRGGNHPGLVLRGVPTGASGWRCTQREPDSRKPGAEVVKALTETAIGGVADVDRCSELARLLPLTPVGVETFGPPTGMLRSARQRIRPAGVAYLERDPCSQRETVVRSAASTARWGQNRIVRPATGDVYVPHTGAAPPARILLAAH